MDSKSCTASPSFKPVGAKLERTDTSRSAFHAPFEAAFKREMESHTSSPYIPRTTELVLDILHERIRLACAALSGPCILLCARPARFRDQLVIYHVQSLGDCANLRDFDSGEVTPCTNGGIRHGGRISEFEVRICLMHQKMWMRMTFV